MIDFNQLIDKYLHREVRPRAEGRYYPSEIGGCIRKIWYGYKQPKERPTDVIKIFQMGNMIHDFIADVLRSEKNPEIELLKTEVPFRENIDDFMISGRVDDLLMIKSSGRTVLVEVKSTKMVSMAKEPQPSHVMQLQVYLHFLKLRYGMIVYVEKNTLQTKWFNVEYDEAAAEDAIKRFRRLHLAVSKNEMPEPEARITSGKEWECSYCDWKDECWGTQKTAEQI
jgi:CRISPR/Cas system-associated exonuclease Cas4 (RecB family)